MFLMYFFSLLLEKKILLVLVGFSTSTFFVLRTLLREVSDVIPFCVCKLFFLWKYHDSEIGLMDSKTIFVHQVGNAIGPIVIRR